MHQRQSYTQWFMIIGLCVVLGAPVALYFLTTSRVSEIVPSVLQSKKIPTVSDQYSATSELSGYTLQLADTQFLEYATSTMNVFATDALADPKHFKTMKNITKRKSVSRIRFVLVPQVTNPIGFVVGKRAEVLGSGDYDINGDALIIRIVLNFDALARAGKADAESMENTFFDTAIKTMQYAKGRMDPNEDGRIFTKISADTKEYIDTGIFIRPFRITQH